MKIRELDMSLLNLNTPPEEKMEEDKDKFYKEL